MTNIDGAEPEVEIQEPEEQLYVGVDQELEQELTNFVDTQGKHRFISNPVSLSQTQVLYFC